MNSKELIKQYYAAFNRKDWRGMLEFLSDEIAHDINQGKREMGKMAFSAFLDAMNTHYDENLSNIVIMTSEGGRHAAAEFICKGTYLKTAQGLPEAKGQTYTLPVGAFFDISSDSKILRISNYYNMNDWMAQVS